MTACRRHETRRLAQLTPYKRQRSVVRAETVCLVHIGDMRHITAVKHRLSHLYEMLVCVSISFTTLRLSACMVLIALRA
ncbi:MAG: hypothetical protein IKP54_11485 [Bacteroidales bacterium]|nr:hypothetical protein [Bacteroidales bacterium]